MVKIEGIIEQINSRLNYERMDSDEEAEQVMESIAATSPETRRELHAWIERFFKVGIPQKAVCEDHCAPFDFLADAFFEREPNMLVYASRGSGKTKNFAILHHLNSHFKPGCWTTNVGSIEAQAKRCYDYMKHQIAQLKGYEKIDGEPLISSTSWKNGSKVEILPGTLKQVSGPRPHKAAADELDWWDWETLMQFVNMPSGGDGISAQTFYSSTRYKSYGVMTRLLQEAKERRLKTYSWCIYEVAERCVNRDCKSCLLKDKCQGRAKRSAGFVPIDEIINSRFLMNDEETWDIQQEIKEPSKKGRVYSDFGEKSIIDFYEFNPSWKTYACQDFGFAEDFPAVSLHVQLSPDNRVFVFKETYDTGISISTLAEEKYKSLHNKFHHLAWICDPARPGDISELKKAGLPALGHSSKILDGIPVVRRFISPPGKPESDLYVLRSACPNFIFEMQSYHFPEKAGVVLSEIPEKEFDHGPDALRYLLHFLFGARQKEARFKRMVIEEETLVRESAVVLGSGTREEEGERMTDDDGRPVAKQMGLANVFRE